MIVHLYDDLLSRANHRVRHVGHEPGMTVADALVAAGASWAQAAVLVNGHVADADDVLAPDDTLQAAPKPQDPTTLVLIAVSLATTAASALLSRRIRAPQLKDRGDSDAQRYGFGRFSNDAFAGEQVPVVLGRHPRYGGKVIAVVPGEGADGESRVKMLLCFGEGELTSIAGQNADFDGLDAATLDLWLNDQPASSFPGCRAWGRMGTDDQAVIPGFDDAESLREVGTGAGVDLVNTSGSDRTGTDDAESHTYTTSGPVDAVRVRVRLSGGLYTLDDSGQVDTARVKYRVRHRLTAGPGSWSDWTVVTIERAEQAEFVSDLRINDLGSSGSPAQRDIQVQRVTPDVADALTRDELNWDQVIEITLGDNTYAGFALLALELIASEQLTGIPRVSAEADGVAVRVWDGVSDPLDPEWDTEWSSNPAYLALAYLTNATWGMGEPDTRVDFPSLIAWAEYCDEAVSLAAGGTRPRFACNLVIDQPGSDIDRLRTICAVGNCVPVLSGNLWRFIVDRPQTSPAEVFTDGSIAAEPQTGAPVMEYTREYAADGYVRPNQIVVQFANELAGGEADVLVWPEAGELWLADETPKPRRVSLEGETHPEQVLTKARYLLKRERGLTRTIALETTRPAVAAEPGDRIDVACGFVGWGLASGRVRSAASRTIAIDRPVTLDDGVTYVVRVVHQDDSVELATVASPAGYYPEGAEIEVEGDWAAEPAEFDEYVLGQSGVEVKPFTMVGLSLADAESIRWRVEAVEYDEDVYDDTVDAVDLPDYSTLRREFTPPGPVTRLVVFERFSNQIRTVELAWAQEPADAEITASFRVYRRAVGTVTWVPVPGPSITRRSYLIELGAIDRAYQFCVIAVTHSGHALSPYDPRVLIANIVYGLSADPPPPPASLTLTQDTDNTYLLEWAAVDGAVEYQVLAGGDTTSLPNVGAEDCLVLLRTTETSTEVELPPGVACRFYARAVGSNGRLSFTAATVSEATPATPGGRSVVDTTAHDLSAGTASNVVWDSGDSRLELDDADSPGTWTSAEVDLSTLAYTELSFRLATANDAEDPAIEDDPFRVPSVEADQWGVVDAGPPPVVGMLMPPYPDTAQSWLIEVRLHDGSAWGAWETWPGYTEVIGTIRKYQVRVTLSRPQAPYRPAVRGLTVVAVR